MKVFVASELSPRTVNTPKIDILYQWRTVELEKSITNIDGSGHGGLSLEGEAGAEGAAEESCTERGNYGDCEWGSDAPAVGCTPDAMPRRKRRARELSSSSSAAERDITVLSDDDDDEEQATADLTLHILAKAETRGREWADQAQVVVLDSESEEDAFSGRVEPDGEIEREQTPLRPCDVAGDEAVAEPVVSAKGRKKKRKKEKERERKREKEKEKEKKKKKKEKKKEITANVVNTEDTQAEPDEPAELKLPDAEESIAMRKLLRGPRYFDPPEEQGETCYSCGQQGHRAADCTEQPRQKPCFVCGDFGHDGYDCVEKIECFDCGKIGHVARNCPNKQYQPRKHTGLCLLCGRLGHDVSSCPGEYDPDDFKQVHCYICKQRGHLCCVEVVDESLTPASCYQCGDLGHIGLGCSRQDGDKGDKSSCYRCGQEGHFARECQRTSRDYNIKQRRHSWPAPWSADYGRFGDQEHPFTPACQIKPIPFKKHLEQAQASSGKKKKIDDGKRGSKRKQKEDASFQYPLDKQYRLDNRGLHI